MELTTRCVHFAGCTSHPDGQWMNQNARNLTDPEDGFVIGKRYVLMDRDGTFCAGFREILKDEGAEPRFLPPRSPNQDAHIERFMRSVKSEALDRMIFFGQRSLARAVREYLTH